MIRKWIGTVNYVLAGLAAFLLLVAIVVMFMRPSTIVEPSVDELAKKNKSLPDPVFTQPEKSYDALGEPLLSLKFVAPSTQIPDLRPYLSYFGTNVRPDTAQGQTLLHFGLTGGAFAPIAPGQPLYLQYDRSQTPGKYIFSPDNATSNLWITAEPKDNTANVTVHLRDEQGKMVMEPAARAHISLQEKEFARFGGGTWEIGKYRVDGTLLARQRARWFGQDEFLNAHGGEEYKDFENKERIEFGEGDDRYSVYAGVGDCLIWDGKRWTPAKDVPDSKTYPLLCVKGVDERLMRLELWDVGGKGRVALSLLRSTEPWAPKAIQRDFKFVSARTLSQYIFDVRNERTTLRPQDWLLLTDKGWKRLESPEDIDDYVDRKAVGVLFVFEGLVKKEGGGQVLVATLYNSSRTAAEQIEIPIDQSAPSVATPTAQPQAPANGSPSPQQQQETPFIPVPQAPPVNPEMQPHAPEPPQDTAPEPDLPQEPLGAMKEEQSPIAVDTQPAAVAVSSQSSLTASQKPKPTTVLKKRVMAQAETPKAKTISKTVTLPVSVKKQNTHLQGLPIRMSDKE